MKFNPQYIIAAAAFLFSHNSQATSPVPHKIPSQPIAAQHPDPKVLEAFPAAPQGQVQHVITVPPQADEFSFRIGVTVGRMQETDGVNRMHLSGRLVETPIPGWGYNYYQYEGNPSQSISTRIGARPGRPPVTKFVSIQEEIMRYNSRMPVVVYAPSGLDVRYRIYQGGVWQTAAQTVSPSTDQNSQNTASIIGTACEGVQLAPTHPGQVGVNQAGIAGLYSDSSAQIPTGSIVSVRLYDSRLMDKDSTYAQNKTIIPSLPARIFLPQPLTRTDIVAPAIRVTIRNAAGQLLYVNDTVTPVNCKGETKIQLKKIR